MISARCSAHLGEQLLRALALGRETACDHLGLVGARRVELGDDHQRAVGRELAAVAQHGVGGIAEAQAVDEHDTRIHGARTPERPALELQHVAVVGHVHASGLEHPSARPAARAPQACASRRAPE